MPFERKQVLSTSDVVEEVLVGGFSEVAIINSEIAGRRAIKRLRDDVLKDGGTMAATQFVRECNTWFVKLANAPYVARAFFPLPQLDNLGPVLFMEYVEGVSLRQLLTPPRRLSVSQTRRLGRQIAEALAFAHKQKTHHRDLKPSNVLINHRNEVRVIDWGLCGSPDTPGFAALTPEYSSPERRGNPALNDAKDDIYALGVILYEGLTGQKPDAMPEAETVRQRLLGVHPTPPQAMVEIIVRTLAIDPALRPKAAELVELFGRADLISEIDKREKLFPFCQERRSESGEEIGCGFISAQPPRPGMLCPICNKVMYFRQPRPTPPGMIRIPAGTFAHGLTERQAVAALLATGREADPRLVSQLASKSVDRVFVLAFDIDEFPVTNAEFAEFCKACNYPEPESLASRKNTQPDHPVVQVTWKDALCYTLWKGKRLPEPLEWEKAARGDKDDRPYPWGENWEGDRCNHSGSLQFRGTSPVDYFAHGEKNGRSLFGVADMVGNVREWVAEGNQPGGRQLRGGSCMETNAVYGLVTFSREADVEYHDEGTGFRCAVDIQYEDVELK